MRRTYSIHAADLNSQTTIVLLLAAADNMVAEYGLDDASVRGGLHTCSVQPMCCAPGVQPTALAFAPPLSYYTEV